MGKGQSKHGQCYLVNAHFNPLCQLEDTNSLQSVETPLTSQDSGLQLTPEISFTLSEEDKTNSDKNIPAKCALQVFLPKESVNAVLKNSTMDVKLENSSATETPRKKQSKVTLECVQNNNHSEKQEFSFVLKNYTGAETDKNDVEKIVLNSICEALKSSLKLPPSGTHSLKVHLTLSPDQEQTLSSLQKSCAVEIPPAEKTECAKGAPGAIAPDSPCQHSAGDPISPAVTLIPDKQANVFAKCCQQDSVKNLLHSPLRSSKHEASPSPRSRRQRMVTEKRDARRWVDAAQVGRRDFVLPNFKGTPRHSIARDRQYQHHVEHHVNVGDCSHYLDLARMKVSETKDCIHNTDHRCDLRCLNPAYCSPRQLDRSHKISHFQKCSNSEFSKPTTPKKHSEELRHKLRESELHSGVLKYKLLQKAKNNLVDSDLCDVEDKQSNELDAQHQHRRSRSHDTNQYSIVNSPKLVHRTCNCTKCTTSLHCDDMVPLSPNRRHRHCQKKREKDKLRAMEQVARWLEREDANRGKKQTNVSQNSEICNQDNVIERHEYHHIHEHHHYYHYVES